MPSIPANQFQLMNSTSGLANGEFKFVAPPNLAQIRPGMEHIMVSGRPQAMSGVCQPFTGNGFGQPDGAMSPRFPLMPHAVQQQIVRPIMSQYISGQQQHMLSASALGGLDSGRPIEGLPTAAGRPSSAASRMSDVTTVPQMLPQQRPAHNPQSQPEMQSNRGNIPLIPQSLDSKIHEMNKWLFSRPMNGQSVDLAHWFESFAREFFSDNATLTIVHFDPHGPFQAPRKFTIGRIMIPRFFRSMFEGGIVDLQFIVRSCRDFPNTKDRLMTLDCDRLTMVTTHFKPVAMTVVTDTQLVCDFGFDDLRMKSWHMTVIQGREYLERSKWMESVRTDTSIRNGLTCFTLMFLKLCAILEPMQEIMVQNKQTPNLKPRDNLRRMVSSMIESANPHAAQTTGTANPEEPTAKPAAPKRQRKRKGSASGDRATPNGSNSGGGFGGRKKKETNPNPGGPNPVVPSPGAVAGRSLVDVMVVQEPSMMGGEMGDNDERRISRLENGQFDPMTVGPNRPTSFPHAAAPGSIMRPRHQFHPAMGQFPMGPGGPNPFLAQGMIPPGAQQPPYMMHDGPGSMILRQQLRNDNFAAASMRGIHTFGLPRPFQPRMPHPMAATSPSNNQPIRPLPIAPNANEPNAFHPAGMIKEEPARSVPGGPFVPNVASPLEPQDGSASANNSLNTSTNSIVNPSVPNSSMNESSNASFLKTEPLTPSFKPEPNA